MARATGAITYCVTAGVALRMPSFSRAVFSTRDGVACA
jgi:hypothetical protein